MNNLDELNVYLKKRGWWFFPHTQTRNISYVAFHWYALIWNVTKFQTMDISAQDTPMGVERYFNKLIGICASSFKSVTSEYMLWIKFMSTLLEIALGRMLYYAFDFKSTLV